MESSLLVLCGEPTWIGQLSGHSCCGLPIVSVATHTWAPPNQLEVTMRVTCNVPRQLARTLHATYTLNPELAGGGGGAVLRQGCVLAKQVLVMW